MRRPLEIFLPLCGVIAGIFISTSIFLSSIQYTGWQNESLSPTTHFVSELGRVGISEWAWCFNTSLILGGFCLMPFMVSTGRFYNHKLGYLAMTFGLIGAVACVGVGLFPVNYDYLHYFSAYTFFTCSCIGISIIGLAILLDKRNKLPKSLVLFNLLIIVLTIAMGLQPTELMDVMDEDPINFERPSFWWMTTLEWLTLGSLLLWITIVGSFVSYRRYKEVY